MNASSVMTDIEFRLLNAFQRDFPLLPCPFAAIADELGTNQATVLDTLQRLQDAGMVSRTGPVFRPNAIGASTLAALAVPPERLAQVAAYVNTHPEVNHNYEREHRFNLWFVVTAASDERLRAVLRDIEDACECGLVLKLPMLEDYHIDLGFDLSPGAADRTGRGLAVSAESCGARATAIRLDATERTLVRALQNGLPYVAHPFACLGLPETEAIGIIERWVGTGVIKRFGVIVRHHELGFTANGMTVWDIPDTDVREAGRRIAASGGVTLCYRRPRRLPDWPYNLFCMIHGKDRGDVESRIAGLRESCGLGAYPQEVLFSLRRFRQRGAYYAPETAHG